MKNNLSIALIGATGATGFQFLKLALDAGYHVKALVRNPAKLQIKHPLLSVIKGDVLKKQSVVDCLKETSIVVSLFGHVKDSPKWIQSQGTANIIEVMSALGIQRIISLSGGGLPFPEKDTPKFKDHLIRGIMKLIVPHILDDAIKHAELLRSSGLKWTIVRGPRLTNKPAAHQYQVGWVGHQSGTQISRADLASFILEVLRNGGYEFDMPFVTS